jgi:uncharacterized membrane protein
VAVIEVHAPQGGGAARPGWVLRPRRALTARQFVTLYLVLAVMVSAVAGYSFAFGNAFAPLFAALDLLIVALALRWVWRNGERQEWLWCSEDRLEVAEAPGAPPRFSEHPAWVRLLLDDPAAPRHLWLCSRGRRVEIGGFLAPDERLAFAGQLRQALGALRAPGPSSELRSSA